MIRIPAISLLLFFCSSLLAQQITLSETQLDFGIVLESSPASLSVALTNPSDESVTIFALLPETNGFSVSPDSLMLAPGATDSFQIDFLPIHNLYHNQELLLIPNNYRGALSLDLRAQGRYSRTYYSTTENKSGSALKSALKSRLGQGYIQLTYSAARDHMYMTIDNQKTNGQGAGVNTLECVYTGTQVTSYSDRTDAQLQGFNTEHTFPQGFFGQNLPMRSDIHHLFPTTVSSNSERGNKPFGVVTNPTWQVGGSKSGSSNFEPRDTHKGAVARAMFYFVVRYQDYANHFHNQETILRQWHEDFPPDAVDRKRNGDVQSVQGNRNPFVDYPQLINRMAALTGNADLPDVESYRLPELEIDFDTVTKPTVYHYPIVNTGNVPLTIEAPQFNDNRLSETSGTNFPATLVPGEDLPMEITLNTVDNPGLDASMSIAVSNGDTLDIPVVAFWTREASIDKSWPTGWVLRPVPGGYVVDFDSPHSRHWTLTSLQGRLVQEGVQDGNSLRIGMHEMLTGMYLLGVEASGRWSFRRLRW